MAISISSPEMCILLRREAGIGRLHIALTLARARLHQLVMQEQTLLVRVFRLQLELRRPPGRLVVDIGQGLPQPSDVDVGSASRKSGQLVE
jgi:hypothetical protein